MSERVQRTDPGLWEKVKQDLTRSGTGGRPDQWSARKAQLAVQEYKRQGGGYRGEKPETTSLQQWTEEDWGTKSGRRSRDTGERYLPREAREALSDEDYRRTSDKKRRDARRGRQHSGQPPRIAGKTAKYRHGTAGAGRSGKSKAVLYEDVKRAGIAGRSKMSKSELERALAR
jgi:hypothetical protein